MRPGFSFHGRILTKRDKAVSEDSRQKAVTPHVIFLRQMAAETVACRATPAKRSATVAPTRHKHSSWFCRCGTRSCWWSSRAGCSGRALWARTPHRPAQKVLKCMVLAQSFHEIIRRLHAKRMYRPEDREHEEPYKEVHHGAMRDSHHRHLPIVQGPVVIEDSEGIPDLPPQMHSRRFVREWKDVRCKSDEVPASTQALDRRENGTADLEDEVEQSQGKQPPQRTLWRSWRDHGAQNDCPGDAGEPDDRGEPCFNTLSSLVFRREAA